ncbi:hypothetical protein MBM_07204 [Drepanopeziza brunnea f. sp. 'multigermtubi' MB_m1]|uniref:Uncharacterized protein n=1 Tax=Marssonina brunnea f. sp. multigermtubi (strain MB_m1) TaxID=1072389 RepID=K1X0V0_MARBU|nr:uncharacterized protein MBM_07204 [Drepanopeziza brunnea f. sp. 'multigermtubi' MB_m1]EKD14483.1 hypothetical protein MBM_07204 [Drepanopeziza brunnea f. sp. 'multigermtubi' MB_m1]
MSTQTSATTTSSSPDPEKSLDSLKPTISQHELHHEHGIKTIDFAPGSYVQSNNASSSPSLSSSSSSSSPGDEVELMRRMSLGNRVQKMLWNPRAKYTRRGKIARALERDRVI